MRQNKITHKNHQDGNAFFMILMAVVLFAALAFTFSKGVQQGGENISERQAELAATDIVTYAQHMERAVQALIARGISETDLDFDNNSVTGYANIACPASPDPSRCAEGAVFKTTGAKLDWQNPPANVNNNAPYFIGTNQVGHSTETADPKARDLTLILPVKARVCDALNAMIGQHATWTSASALNSTTKFTGDFTVPASTGINWSGTDTAPRTSGCFCIGSSPCLTTDEHYFYHILYER